MLSQTAEYALRAMVHLARKEKDGTALRAEEIATDLHVPRNYLSKILHSLAREGLLDSTRGPHGGFRLSAPAGEIQLSRVIEVFEPELLADDQRCLMGRTLCSDDEPCPAHGRWKEVSRAVQAFFHRTTLGDLAGDRGETRVLDAGRRDVSPSGEPRAGESGQT